MPTFSEIVDELTAELIRPDLRPTIASYLNQSLREVHFRSNTQSPVLFASSREEEEITSDSVDNFTWPITKASRFQALEAAYCPSIGYYILPRNPKVIHLDSDSPQERYYWYRSGPFIIFSGIPVSAKIRLTYFLYPPRFKYFPVTARDVFWDADTQSYNYTSEANLPAHVHWLLTDWDEAVLKEGVRAKVWKRMGDETRAKMSFSAFEAGRQMLWNAEAVS